MRTKLEKALHIAIYGVLCAMLLLCAVNAGLNADVKGALFFLAMSGTVVALYFLSKHAHSI